MEIVLIGPSRNYFFNFYVSVPPNELQTTGIFILLYTYFNHSQLFMWKLLPICLITQYMRPDGPVLSNLIGITL
jgi:hypothetical protein